MMTNYDRQKVISGMDACTDSRDCEECPYSAEYDRRTDCMYALIMDMAEMIDNDVAEMIDEFKQRQEAQEPTDGDTISRSALLAAYDAAHKGPPGGARKLIVEAPAVTLKAQEPRVIPAEELVSHKSVVWVENVTGMAPTRAMLFCITGDRGVFFSTEGKLIWNEGSWWSELISCLMLNYGKTWRCWTSRPTDEQREAVKWEV